MSDVRQSPQFAQFMKDLGWQIESFQGQFVYLRKFPLIGYFAKIPRPEFPLPLDSLRKFIKDQQIFKFKIAPNVITTNNNYDIFRSQIINSGLKIENFPFNPVTTIQITLKQTIDNIFNNFFSAKRRAVRRALKNKVKVKESKDIDIFIKIRKRQYFPLGVLMEKEMKCLWKNFYPKNASLLLAYTVKGGPVGGIFLLFYQKMVYYWFASCLPEGKKLFAPTLLVWEALKLSKTRGCTIFDFEGICDHRFPKASISWKGFTKFKEGFGGKKIIFIENFTT